MQTVDKAVELLGLFSEREAELGLSDIARRAQFDKATTRRLLLALAKHGLIEQDQDSRRYRIGPGVLRLAQIREATLPVHSVVQPVLRRLVDGTGETAHFALRSGQELATIAMQESSRSNRVNMVLGERLPLHATASGLVIMAYIDSEELPSLVTASLEKYTDATLTDPVAIRELLRHTRELGFVTNLGYYEADVCSIAAPVFDPASRPMGAVAVAAPSTRFGNEAQATMQTLVIGAAAEITTRLGGRAPTAQVA